MTYTPGFDVAEPATLTTAPVPVAPESLTAGLAADGAGGMIAGDDGAAWAKVGHVFSTTLAAQRYDGATNGQFQATSDSFDEANRQIALAGGGQLENPLSGGYTIAARQRYMDANGHAPDLTDPHTQVDFNQYRIGAWQDDLARLRADNPAVPAFAQSDIEQMAKDRTNQAVQGADEAWKNAPAGPASWAAWAAGAGVAMMRDPIMAASTVIGGGELKAASVFGRLIEAGVKEAAQNAAVQAVAEPWVQKWRAERGQDSGFVPALEDVGVAALFGAGAGGARALFHGAPKPLASPDLVGRAIGGDLDAAKELAGALPPDIAPTLHAAVASEGMDRAAMADSGAPAGADPVLARQAIRHVESPMDDPLPGFGSDDARTAATQAIDAQTVPDQQAAILGTHAPADRVPEPVNVVDTLPERSRQVEKLKRDLLQTSPEPGLDTSGDGVTPGSTIMPAEPGTHSLDEPVPVGFTTAKGSTYTVHEDGTTTRNKSFHVEHGKDDVGLKPRSARTIYVDSDAAPHLSGAGLDQPEGHRGYRVLIHNGKATLLGWNMKESRWGSWAEGRDVPFSTKPEVGKSPLELWQRTNEFSGKQRAGETIDESYAGMHAGNKITQIDHAPAEDPLSAAVREEFNALHPDDQRALHQAAYEAGLTEVPPAEQVKSGLQLQPMSHDEVGYRKPAGVDDRVYSIKQDGEHVGVLHVRVDGNAARIHDVYTLASSREGARGAFGTAAVRGALRQFLAENPQITKLTGERVSGARATGGWGYSGTGKEVSVDVPAFMRAHEAVQTAADDGAIARGEAAAGGASKTKQKKPGRVLSALEFLAHGGGLADHPEVRAVLDGNPFVPGAGRLVRKKGGMSLDDALQSLKDAGYLFDPADHGRGEATLDGRAVLDLIDREARGEKIYPLNAERPAKAAEEGSPEYATAYDTARATIRTEAEKYDMGPLDLMAEHRAAELIANGHETDHLAAYERAAMEEARADAFADEIIKDGFFDGTPFAEWGREPAHEPPVPFDLGEASGLRGGVAEEGASEPAGRGELATSGDAVRADGEGAGAVPAEAGRSELGAADAGGQVAGGAGLAAEPGAEGLPQTLIPGVEPVSTRDRLSVEAAKPMRGGNAAMPAGGLFDEGARAQGDLLSMVPLADRIDGGDTRLVPRSEVLDQRPREELLAHLVNDCSI